VTMLRTYTYKTIVGEITVRAVGPESAEELAMLRLVELLMPLPQPSVWPKPYPPPPGILRARPRFQGVRVPSVLPPVDPRIPSKEFPTGAVY
jgi:hypothetical protein